MARRYNKDMDNVIAINAESDLGEMFVAEMADFLKRGKSAEWILTRAEKAFAREDINQNQLRRIEALVEG